MFTECVLQLSKSSALTCCKKVPKYCDNEVHSSLYCAKRYTESFHEVVEVTLIINVEGLDEDVRVLGYAVYPEANCVSLIGLALADEVELVL